jgi:hypothetical protein
VVKNKKSFSWSGAFQKLVDFVALIEHLPYGASWMTEKKVARAALGAGIFIMALGAALFAVAWRAKITWLGETAFAITLVGWMMVILGFAFGVIGWASGVFSRGKAPQRKSKK